MTRDDHDGLIKELPPGAGLFSAGNLKDVSVIYLSVG